MSETSPPTPPAETANNATATTTPPPATETSSTTPPETTESSEIEGTLLNTKTEPPKDPAKEPPKAEGPLEKYADFTVPDGYTLDTNVATDASALFKELGLNQAQAQKAVDFYSKHAIESSNLALQTVKDMRAGWVDQIRSSDEFRGEFAADGKIRSDSKVLVGISRMLDSLGDSKLAGEFRQAMDLTGAGDHPAFFRVMARLSQHFAEGSAVTGNGPSPHGQSPNGQAQRRSAAAEIYPNLASGG